jgi:hypothetical protein
MYAVGTLVGRGRESRMIARNLCFLLLLSLLPSTGWAANVYELDAGVYHKNKPKVKRVLEELHPTSTAWVYRSSHNGWKDRSHHNKRRDNVLILPDTSTRELTLIVWFHGLGGFSEKTFRRVSRQLDQVVDNGHSVAVAIPEMPWSINTKTKRSRQSQIWRKKGSFKSYVEDTIKILKWHYLIMRGEGLDVVDIVVVGHSAGGSSIASASVEGGICDLNVSNVVWSDATYGSWLKRAHRGCLGRTNEDIKTIILVRKWDKPYHRARRFLKSLKNHSYDFRVLPRKRYRHSRIGNEALLLSDLFPVGC